jgi:hypothetical protein
MVVQSQVYRTLHQFQRHVLASDSVGGSVYIQPYLVFYKVLDLGLGLGLERLQEHNLHGHRGLSYPSDSVC